ncbi:MAG: hypothetical protein AB1755_01630 [Candidatus Omnitrophota bacterium]
MKNKKNTKLEKPSVEYDSQRETNVLLEEMNKGIKLIGEQHSSIIRKLEEHDKSFLRIESELNSVKMAVMDISHQVNGVKIKQEETYKKLSTVIDNHEQRLTKPEVI